MKFVLKAHLSIDKRTAGDPPHHPVRVNPNAILMIHNQMNTSEKYQARGGHGAAAPDRRAGGGSKVADDPRQDGR